MQAVMIPITNGAGTLVDEDIAKDFANKKLRLRDKKKPYLSFQKNGRTEYLHRHITHAPRGLIVDHINGLIDFV